MKHYKYTVNGIDHIVQAESDEEAARRGYTPLDTDGDDRKPAGKKATPANKSAAPETK